MTPLIRSKVSSAVFVASATAIVFLCSLAGTLQLTLTLMKRERLQWQHRTEAEAVHLAGLLRTSLLDKFGALPRVGVWWQLQGRPLDAADWQTDMRLFFDSSSGLQRIVWMDGSSQRSWSAEPNRTPEAQRFDAVPAALKVLKAVSARTRSLAISSLIEQPGGRPAVYVCVPILRQGSPSAYVAGLYDVTELLKSALQRKVPTDYSISIVADGREVGVFNAEPGKSSGIEQSASVVLPNVTWLVRVRAVPDDLQSLRRVMLGFGLAVSLLLSTSTLMGGIAYLRTIALKHEIRERRSAEEQVQVLNRDLQRRLADFQTLLEVTPIGIAVSHDAECRTIWINPALAAMLGVAEGQNISKSGPDADKLQFQVLRGGQPLAPEELPMQVAGRTGREVVGEELDIVSEDGRVIHTLAYTAPLFDENRRVRGVLHASVDITQRIGAEQERNLLEQKLLRAEKFKSLALMAGGLAHDMNNLLTTVIGNESLALETLPRDSYTRELVLNSLAASQKAAGLMQQLTRYTGSKYYSAQPLDISRVIRDLQAGFQTFVPGHIELSFDLSDELPVVRAGLTEIQQVLQNLLTNAVDAIGERSGRISITTTRYELTREAIEALFSTEQELSPGLYVQLVVSDDGCGMSSETRAKVFDPFFTTKFVGRGLGLSEVQGVVRGHRGGIRVESSSTAGTKMVLLFPALTTQSQTVAASNR
jgi:signal transduction histidine kinase